jgi:surface antigen
MHKSVLALLAAGAMPLAACTTTDDGMMESAATGAGVGAAVGAGAGVLIGGLTPIEGALLGAAVGGLAGAVWHDQDRDGRADGYMYNGRYYEGRPAYQQEQAPAYQAPVRSGERG